MPLIFLKIKLKKVIGKARFDVQQSTRHTSFLVNMDTSASGPDSLIPDPDPAF